MSVPSTLFVCENFFINEAGVDFDDTGDEVRNTNRENVVKLLQIALEHGDDEGC